MIPPIRHFDWKTNVSQLFGVNKSIYLDRFGIPGHNGIDIVIPPDSYGRDVVSAHDGQVTLVFRDEPTRKNGNGVYIQGYDGDNYVDTNYWHLSEILVTSGQTVKAGDIIGRIGNTGFVSPPPTADCPHCGSHLHFGVRRIKILPGSYTELVPTDYKGFCDPVQFLFQPNDRLPISFNRNLYFGCQGDDVSWLQTILKLEGFGKEYEPIGQFGPKTLRDVILLQKKYGIQPTFGFVGPITRSFLTTKYR